TFDKLYLDEIRNKNAGSQIIEFLKEAFEFSVLIQFLKENPKEYEKFKKRKNENKNQSLRNLIGGYEKKLVEYLRDKFFPNEEHQKEIRDKFIQFNLKEAIEDLLFIPVDEDIEWKLGEEHVVFV